jgi:hypothetical protein
MNKFKNLKACSHPDLLSNNFSHSSLILYYLSILYSHSILLYLFIAFSTSSKLKIEIKITQIKISQKVRQNVLIMF